jgi:SNF2 family DNA or RNA helicase
MLGLIKLAHLNDDVKLHPHQQHFVDKPGNAVIAAHPVGSGKTLSGIARFEHLRDTGAAHRALVVVPSSLRNNFGQEGVAKFTNSSFNIIGNQQERQQGLAHATNPESDYNIVSYDLFRKAPQQYLQDAKADTLILDEFHRGKNEGTLTTESLKSAKGYYQNLIGLTGSPVSNSISDIQPLMEIAGNTNLGASKKEFGHRYFKRDNSKPYRGLSEERRPIIGFNHRKDLQNELGNVIDYVDEREIQQLAKMPHKKIDIVHVPISEEQAKFYRGLLNKNPAVKKMILAKRSETMKDDETSKAFNQLIEARKLMNSIGSVRPKISLSESAVRTPKTNQLLNDLQDHLAHTPDGQALLFSHLINGGVDVMEQGLKDRHIPYGKFIGKGNEDVTEASRQQDVVDYNTGKKHVMIVSPAGGEGLSMNNTTWEGVLDPHYNPEKMNQMEARGVRSGGLAHRSEAERNVHINRYLATMPKTFGIFKSRIKTPDEFIYEIAQRKDQQNEMLRQLLLEGQRRQRREAARQKIQNL